LRRFFRFIYYLPLDKNKISFIIVAQFLKLTTKNKFMEVVMLLIILFIAIIPFSLFSQSLSGVIIIPRDATNNVVVFVDMSYFKISPFGGVAISRELLGMEKIFVFGEIRTDGNKKIEKNMKFQFKVTAIPAPTTKKNDEVRVYYFEGKAIELDSDIVLFLKGFLFTPRNLESIFNPFPNQFRLNYWFFLDK
jgi:hypothetical protein